MNKTKRIEVNCPVCGNRAYQVLYEPWVSVDDPVKLYGAASGIQGTQRLVRCKTCSMIYENPRYPEEVIIQGYMSSQESGHDSQHPMRVRSFERALRKLAPMLPPPGSTVLDIGTAGGAFLEAAESFGYKTWGMEPSAYLAAEGKRRGLQVEQGTIERHPFEARRFDLISLWDVIEHLVDPLESLRQIRGLLKPNGVLLVNFPDIGTWQAKLAGKRFWWILSVHLHHFTRATLQEICRRAGFETFHFRPYWQILEFGYLEQMAIHYGIPLARLLHRLTPQPIRRLPFFYYASQTTALSKPIP